MDGAEGSECEFEEKETVFATLPPLEGRWQTTKESDGEVSTTDAGRWEGRGHLSVTSLRTGDSSPQGEPSPCAGTRDGGVREEGGDIYKVGQGRGKNIFLSCGKSGGRMVQNLCVRSKIPLEANKTRSRVCKTTEKKF